MIIPNYLLSHMAFSLEFHFLLIVLQQKVRKEYTFFNSFEVECVIIRYVSLMFFFFFRMVHIFIVLLSENFYIVFNQYIVLAYFLDHYHFCALHNSIFVVGSSITFHVSNSSSNLQHFFLLFYFSNSEKPYRLEIVPIIKHMWLHKMKLAFHSCEGPRNILYKNIKIC